MLTFAQNKSEYKISNQFHPEGNGGWDLLTKEAGSNRLFISHGTMVQAIDVKTGKVVGTIGDMKGVHGIALAPEFNKGFISSGRDTSLVIFDLKTLAVITKLTVTGLNPDVVLYDEFSKRVFVFNGRSRNATVIDAATNAIIGTVELEGKPELAESDGQGKIYVNIENRSMISVIDAKEMKVLKSWSIAPGAEPSGLAFDIKNKRLFSACGNGKMMVSDAENGKVIAEIPIGQGPDGAAFDESLKRVYSPNGDGTLTVIQQISADEYKVLENVNTAKGARTMALDSKSHHLYLPYAEYGEKPEATAENPNPRPKIKEGTFTILEVEPK